MANEQRGSAGQPEVVHNADGGRFEIREGALTAVLEYVLRGDRVTMFHTGVPVELEGRGYGSRLVRAALDHAKSHNLRVIPQCSFVRTYITRHPEYQALVDEM